MLLDRYPKSSIEIHATVLESDGGDGPACLVAAALAVADAGIEMVDIPSSISVVGHAPAAASSANSSAADNGSAVDGGAMSIAIDPSAKESATASFTLTVCLLPRVGLLTHTSHAGEAPAEVFVSALRLAMDGCVSVFEAMRSALHDSAKRKARAAAAAARKPLATSAAGSSAAVAVAAAT